MNRTTRGRHSRLLTVAAGVSGLILVGSLAGCSTAEADPNTLTVQFGQGNDAVYQAYADQFEAANPGVTVTLQSVSTEESNGSNLSVITSSNAPDVALVPGNSPAYNSLVSGGGLRDLAAVWEAADLDNRYAPSVNALTEFDGVHYAIADSLSYYSVIYYNKALVESAGITIPEDHRIGSAEELADMAQKLRAAGSQPLALGGKSGFNASWMLDALLPTSATAEEFENFQTSWNPEVEATASYEDPAFTDALAQLDTFAQDGVYQDGFLGASHDQADALFSAGQAGLRVEGSWFAAILDDTAPDVEYGWLLLPPVNDDAMTQLTGSSTPQFAIPTKAKNPELAEKYLEFMLSVEGQVNAGLAVGGYLPAVNDVPDADLASLPAAVQEMIADGRENGVANGWTSSVPSTIGQALVDPLIQSMYDGKTTPAEIGAEVQAALEKLRK